MSELWKPYDAYRRWCGNNDYYPVDIRVFGKYVVNNRMYHISNYRPGSGEDRERYYKGVKLHNNYVSIYRIIAENNGITRKELYLKAGVNATYLDEIINTLMQQERITFEIKRNSQNQPFSTYHLTVSDRSNRR